MNGLKFKKWVLGVGFLSLISGLSAQENFKSIDEIIAVIGEQIVLKSELEVKSSQYMSSGMPVEDNSTCLFLEELLLQKLMVHQAEVDSVIIGEAQVESELEIRMQYFINQIGSIEKLEAYYGKTLEQIKEEFYDVIHDQLLMQQMQSTIANDVKATPKYVKEFFNQIPQDSIPFINSKIKYAHIALKPKVSEVEKKGALTQIKELQNRLIKGEDFKTLAVLYSDDPGSATAGGELGFMGRDDLVPEFSAAGFSLKKDEISDIVETKYGYHIIQMIERKGNVVNFRHILITPKVNVEDLLKAKSKLDSIKLAIESGDSLTFPLAAEKFSTDKDNKYNGGIVSNPQTGEPYFDVEFLGQYDPTLFFNLENMQPGEISDPLKYTDAEGNKAFHIVKLIERTNPHKANLKDDYLALQNLAESKKKQEALISWVNSKAASSYIEIKPEYLTCKFEANWLKNN